MNLPKLKIPQKPSHITKPILVNNESQTPIIIHSHSRSFSNNLFFEPSLRPIKRRIKYKCKMCGRIFKQKYNARVHFFCRKIPN